MGQTSGLTLPQFWINVDLKYQFWISQPLFCCFIHSGTGAFISYQENSSRIALGCFVLVQLWSEGRSFCPYSLLTSAEVKKKSIPYGTALNMIHLFNQTLPSKKMRMRWENHANSPTVMSFSCYTVLLTPWLSDCSVELEGKRPWLYLGNNDKIWWCKQRLYKKLPP